MWLVSSHLIWNDSNSYSYVYIFKKKKQKIIACEKLPELFLGFQEGKDLKIAEEVSFFLVLMCG